MPERRPNILICMTDHQRGDTVLPESPVVAPNVKRMGREGVIFDQAYCPSPHCCPSRATMMTGLYPSRHGVWNNVCNEMALSRGLKPGVRCWSEDLAKLGYRLAWSGKWHVSVEESPKDRGWEELLVNGHKLYPSSKWDKFRELASRPEKAERGEGEILRPGYGTYRMYGTIPDGQKHHDDETVHRALDALPKLASDGRPWCLFVGMTAPHDPYFAHRKYLDMYRLDEVQLPPSFFGDPSSKPAVVRRMRQQLWGQLSDREIRDGIRHYRALCTYLDDMLGLLLDALDHTGQAEDTVVIYCADHGDYCGDHGLFTKGIPCYRGAYNVPMVVRWPGGTKGAGRRVGRFVSLADIGPTLIELAGGVPDPDLTGRSLVPFLKGGEPPDWREEICTQCNGVELYYTQRSITTDEWKYIYNGFDFDELYNLRDDPHETVNLASDRSLDGIRRELLARMWRFAHREGDDYAINPYITTGLAPYGPAEAFRER